ncbi:hypothetical protein PilKf_02599 [Pillotina sp. SPG140]|jgi:hypothetical protein
MKLERFNAYKRIFNNIHFEAIEMEDAETYPEIRKEVEYYGITDVPAYLIHSDDLVIMVISNMRSSFIKHIFALLDARYVEHTYEYVLEPKERIEG